MGYNNNIIIIHAYDTEACTLEVAKSGALTYYAMGAIHNVSENLILNQGCSQKCNDNENIHVNNNNNKFD